MKCPKCNGKGDYFKEVYNDGKRRREILVKCSRCNGSGELPMTNEEWFCTLSTEEKAEWLSNTFDLCGAGCSNCFVKEMCFDEHNNKMPNDLMCEWLKQPHTIKE